MDIQSKKLSLIERLMNIREASTLDRFEELLLQSELDSMAESSKNDIYQKKTKPLNEFKEDAAKWIQNKKNSK